MKAASAEAAASIQEETFTTPAQPVADIGAEAVFHWQDRHGLTPTQPYTLHVNTTRDAEPRVELQGLDQETAILPNEVLKLNVASSDDYGLKEAWVGWTVRGLDAKKNEKGEKGDAAHTPGGQMQREITSAMEFTPAFYKIPEDSVVELAAYALDYYPKRKPVESWKYTVYVLSPAKHAVCASACRHGRGAQAAWTSASATRSASSRRRRLSAMTKRASPRKKRARTSSTWRPANARTKRP